MAEPVKAVPKPPEKPPRTARQRHGVVLAAAERLCVCAAEFEKQQNSSMAGTSLREAYRTRLLEAALNYGRLVVAHTRNR